MVACWMNSWGTAYVPFRIPETIHARLNGAMLMNLAPLRRAFRSAGWWPLRGRNGTQAVPYGVDGRCSIRLNSPNPGPEGGNIRCHGGKNGVFFQVFSRFSRIFSLMTN